MTFWRKEFAFALGLPTCSPLRHAPYTVTPPSPRLQDAFKVPTLFSAAAWKRAPSRETTPPQQHDSDLPPHHPRKRGTDVQRERAGNDRAPSRGNGARRGGL
jgi:hypothetical protein